MTEEEVLREVIGRLEKLNVPYALTGGLATSFYGRPRSTHDFDIIVHLLSGAGNVKKLLAAFENDFYVSEEGIIDAILHKTMFNIIHRETGFKIDFWILKDDEYDKEAFGRKEKVKMLNADISILSAEDMILGKLLWFKASEIDKHLNDAKGIYEVQKGKLDTEYLKRWALKLSIYDLLVKIG
ncbi:MAG: nucleotidyltransferase domain-containing protein [Candidatus Margulisiibacteriota bacterium]